MSWARCHREKVWCVCRARCHRDKVWCVFWARCDRRRYGVFSGPGVTEEGMVCLPAQGPVSKWSLRQDLLLKLRHVNDSSSRFLSLSSKSCLKLHLETGPRCDREKVWCVCWARCHRDKVWCVCWARCDRDKVWCVCWTRCHRDKVWCVCQPRCDREKVWCVCWTRCHMVCLLGQV